MFSSLGIFLIIISSGGVIFLSARLYRKCFKKNIKEESSFPLLDISVTDTYFEDTNLDPLTESIVVKDVTESFVDDNNSFPSSSLFFMDRNDIVYSEDFEDSDDSDDSEDSVSEDSDDFEDDSPNRTKYYDCKSFNF